MSHAAKLSFAIVLALVAAALNALWLSAEKRPALFVAAATQLPVGEPITDEMLTPVAVPGDASKLRASLIPYPDRAILLGMKTPRDYIGGDMFFQRDIQAPKELASFELIGPFRLISVGERFTKAGTQPEENQLDPGGNTITIAVSANFDERTRRLLQIIDPNRNPNREKITRIIAVQVVPKEEQATSAAIDDKNVVYQTIQLEGIANVPRVLLAGDVIRFVVPAHDSL
jgi:hypothetical protein